MQVNTERRALGLREKLPDIQKTLDTVRFLKTRKVGIYSKEKRICKRILELTFKICVAGLGTDRDDIRAQRYALRKSFGPSHTGSVLVVRGELKLKACID
jgi:hypothetical protein